jgi:hypothetical protein
MSTSPTSQSALKSGAAKDDALGADGHFTFSIADLLANDPGGAAKADVATQFFFGSGADQQHQAEYLQAHGIVDLGGGNYQLGSNAIDFQYSVQMGNKGTWSTADVDVTAPAPVPTLKLGAELLQNWNFEQDNANNDNGFVDLTNIAGWNSEPDTANPMQVQHAKFTPFTGFAAGEQQWLDTSGSPGNIHISQDIEITTGAKAQLSVSVAAENIKYFNGSTDNIYRPDSDDLLQFKLNGETVKEIKLADFADANGEVDWNNFHEFTVDVKGGVGLDHFEIVSSGMDQYTDAASGVIHGYAGFAIDHVSLQEWTPII